MSATVVCACPTCMATRICGCVQRIGPFWCEKHSMHAVETIDLPGVYVCVHPKCRNRWREPDRT